ncbi:hypothetical protein ES703_95382 [subsurface metagenome]
MAESRLDRDRDALGRVVATGNRVVSNTPDELRDAPRNRGHPTVAHAAHGVHRRGGVLHLLEVHGHRYRDDPPVAPWNHRLLLRRVTLLHILEDDGPPVPSVAVDPSLIELAEPYVVSPVEEARLPNHPSGLIRRALPHGHTLGLARDPERTPGVETRVDDATPRARCLGRGDCPVPEGVVDEAETGDSFLHPSKFEGDVVVALESRPLGAAERSVSPVEPPVVFLARVGLVEAGHPHPKPLISVTRVSGLYPVWSIGKFEWKWICSEPERLHDYD